MNYGQPHVDRHALLRDAEREVRSGIEQARQDLARSCPSQVAFFAGPSRLDVGRAAQRATPGQSALFVAAATMRRVSVRVTPGDLPPSVAFRADGTVTLWERGRVLPAGNLSGAKVSFGRGFLILAGGSLNRRVDVSLEALCDASGRDVRSIRFEAWLKSMTEVSGGS